MFQVIVWATDGSAAAETALPYARGLAERGNGKLVVVHVEEHLVGAGVRGYPVRVDEDEVRARVHRLVEELKRDGLDVQLEEVKASAGGAAHAIAQFATMANADLIVAGTRGHGPLAGLLLGSVAHRLLQIAPCPVLTVPPRDRQRATAP